MKKIILLTIIISTLLCVTSCDKNYPEEVTYTGKNTHGFKLNGEKWVRGKSGFVPSECSYEDESQILVVFLISAKEKDNDRITGTIRFTLQSSKFNFTSLHIYPLYGYNDSIEYNFVNIENIDTTKCYCKFDYWASEGKHLEYSEVISGNLQLLRFDTLLVGTFDAQLTDGIDTLTLTDGKFDYQLTNDQK